MIVADFVTQADEEHSIQNYNQTLLKDCTKYSAFNFVSIEIGWVYKVSYVLKSIWTKK